MSAADAAGAARRESYNEDCLPMIRPLIALISVILAACTTQHRRQAVAPPVRDTPIGTDLHARGPGGLLAGHPGPG
jgi:hypothetical protein